MSYLLSSHPRGPILWRSDLPESTQNWPMIGGGAGSRAHTSTTIRRTRDAQLIGRVTMLRPRAPMLARGVEWCPPTPQRYSVTIPCQAAQICGGQSGQNRNVLPDMPPICRKSFLTKNFDRSPWQGTANPPIWRFIHRLDGGSGK